MTALGEAIGVGLELVIDFFAGLGSKRTDGEKRAARRPEHINRRCGICQRELEVETDPLSRDCGGDCWGCVGEAEFGGWDESTSKVEAEIASGLRNSDGSAKR